MEIFHLEYSIEALVLKFPLTSFILILVVVCKIKKTFPSDLGKEKYSEACVHWKL